MFGFINRIKQITGYKPTQTLLIGEFAFEEIRDLNKSVQTSNNTKRHNITILYEMYETNSAQLVLKKFNNEERFHLLQAPSNFNFFSVKVRAESNNEELLFLKDNDNVCLLLNSNNNTSRVFFNSVNPEI